MPKTRHCPQCGGGLPADAPAELCPECLLKLGMASRTGATGGESADGLAETLPKTGGDNASSNSRSAPLEAGEQFGGYRIVRRLGKGGMGAVYEAEHLESGRRVALKILDHSLDSPDARKRFLREGRLAASVNHPNSVYVFGTEEIQDTPAISMELVAGGTLQGRLQQEGPLPVGEAVDVILQVIEGLEAAQAVGVLHRDVKPANCFVDNDGTVKVGDFGLSISTAPRAESNVTAEGVFLGTPAFSSPEQLRGDELDVRSDIFAVGVTLYYLLTGRTPFEASNYVQLLAKVLESSAPSPAAVRSEIPKGLAKVVLGCLEKQPKARFSNYDELRQALLPYTSTAPTPATLGWRFVAGIIDHLIWSFAIFLSCLAWFRDLGAIPFPDLFDSEGIVWPMLGVNVAYMLYFALAEGLWGASPGKAICRLRVVDRHRNIPGVPRALLRVAVYVVFPSMIAFPYFALGLGDPSNAYADWGTMAVGYTYYVLLAVMFLSARRRNGFAGFHDLLSRTRVIQKAAYHARPVLSGKEEPLPDTETTPTVGPYYVLDRLHKTDGEEFALAYDMKLLRKVWIRMSTGEQPPVAEAIRSLGRPGRLRWLNGRRSENECWDAYEAPSGRPLVNFLGHRQPWHLVRYWLFDLAKELNAGLKDGSLPDELALDRIWITADGRAKLLDFPAPGIDAHSPLLESSPITGKDFTSVRCFLNQVAIATLEGRVVDSGEAANQRVAAPLPIRAKVLLDGLSTAPGPEFPIGQFEPLLQRVAFVSRRRRLGLLVGCLVVPVFVAVFFLFSISITEHFLEQHPDVQQLRHCLVHLERIQWRRNRATEQEVEQRDALEVYVAGRFRKTMSGQTTWSSASARGVITPAQRRIAERVLAAHPNPSEKEVNDAAAELKEFLQESSPLLPFPVLLFVFAQFYVILLLCVAFPSLLCALLFRGGPLLRLLGIAIVTRTGARASRLRVVWRSLITWTPCLLAPVALLPLEGSGMTWVLPLMAAVLIAVAVWSTLIPQRGIPDRIAGTYLVPR